MMRLLLLKLLVITCLFPVLTNGQEPYKYTLDSLYQNFTKLESIPKKELNAVKDALYGLSDNGFQEMAEFKALQFLNLYKKKGSLKSQALLLHIIAYNYKKMGQLETAVSFYKKSITLREKFGDDDGMAKAFNNIGNIYYDLGNYGKAIDAHSKSLRIKKKLGDLRGVSISLSGIGNVLSDQKRHIEALDYYKQALVTILKTNDSIHPATVLTNIGLEKHELKEYDSARYYFQKSLNYSRPTENHYIIGYALEGIGTSYLTEGVYDKAEIYLKESLSLRETLKHPLDILLSKLGLARLYNLTNQPDKGIPLAEAALESSKKIKFLKGEQLANEYLSNAYEQKKNYNRAFIHQKAFKILTDSLFTMEERKAIDKTSTQIKVEQETYGIKLKQAKQRVFFNTALIVLTMAFIILTAGFFYSIKKQSQKNRLMLKLKELEAEQKVLVSAQNEREKISQDLHDDLGTTISAIKLVVTNSYGSDKSLLKMVEKANNGIREFFTRTALPDFEDNQLSGAIKATIENLNRTGQLTFEYIEVGDESLIPINFVKPLSRIAIELMVNVAKHAQATECNVQLILEDNEVQLMVEDDGKGFSPKTIKKGMGIDNVYARAHRWNGKVHISSGKTGTTVIIKLPIKDHKRNA